MSTSSKSKKKRSKRLTVRDSRDKAPESFAEQDELPTMETPKIAALETKATLLADRRDRAKKLKDEAAELEADCIAIMEDYEIKVYNRNGVHLTIKETEKLDVKLD